MPKKNDKKKTKKVIFGQWTNTKMAASAVIWQFCAVVLQVEGDEPPPPLAGAARGCCEAWLAPYHHLLENQTALDCMHRCSLTLLLPLTPSHLNF